MENFIFWVILIIIAYCLFVIVAGFLLQEVILPFIDFWNKIRDEMRKENDK